MLRQICIVENKNGLNYNQFLNCNKKGDKHL